MGKRTELLPGTLDLLILKAVSLSPQHGYGILLRIEQITNLESKGLLATEWGVSENNRKAKFYTLTPAGRKQLSEELKDWSRLVEAMAAAIQTKTTGAH